MAEADEKKAEAPQAPEVSPGGDDFSDLLQKSVELIKSQRAEIDKYKALYQALKDAYTGAISAGGGDAVERAVAAARGEPQDETDKEDAAIRAAFLKGF